MVNSLGFKIKIKRIARADTLGTNGAQMPEGGGHGVPGHGKS